MAFTWISTTIMHFIVTNMFRNPLIFVCDFFYDVKHLPIWVFLWIDEVAWFYQRTVLLMNRFCHFWTQNIQNLVIRSLEKVSCRYFKIDWKSKTMQDILITYKAGFSMAIKSKPIINFIFLMPFLLFKSTISYTFVTLRLVDILSNDLYLKKKNRPRKNIEDLPRILPPTTAWMAMANCCLGSSSFSFPTKYFA